MQSNSFFRIEFFTDEIAQIVLDRRDEKSNTFPPPFADFFLEALRELNQKKNLKVLLLTSGKKNIFSTGADVTEFPNFDESGARHLSRVGHHITLFMESMDIPIIAVIDGLCLGGGLELALACDYRICSTRSRFGQPEIQLALIPGWGGCIRLSRLIRSSQAFRLILTGEIIPAETALQIGLVDEVLPPEDLLPHAKKLAEKIASRSKQAIQLAKTTLNLVRQVPPFAATLIESDAFTRAFVHPDSLQAVQNFLNRQNPSGRAQQ
ncbi:MAG: enoyl-CoA hydratase/isomerase family protein [bacterium JZ-2024 1]